MGIRGEAYGATREAEAALTQHGQKQEPDLQKLVLISALLCPCLSLITVPLVRGITSQFLRGSFDDFREMKATDNKNWTFAPSKAKSIRPQLYQIMISFIPLGKASQITKRPVGTNISTHVDYKVFSFFESVEGLIFSCFVKARCKALDLFS